MSRESVRSVLVVFEKQFGKNYAQKFSKSHKNLQNGKFLAIMMSSSLAMMSSIQESNFKKILVITYLHAKNHRSSVSGFRDR